MNIESSRSHLIVILNFSRKSKSDLGRPPVTGKLVLCDLAGSERLKKSGSLGRAQTEAIEINKSLTALGDVISALTQEGSGNKPQVPYRNHKLTQLLQDSIGGSSKTLMVLNISPAESNLDETTMSLRYASRAKTIRNKHAKN